MASDYKEYSLNKLEEWLHDCLSAAEASPQEIYDKIKEVVREEYYYYKNGASRTNELLQLLNGTVQFHIDPVGNKVECDVDDNSEYSKSAWDDFGEKTKTETESKNVKKNPKQWVFPIEEDENGEFFINFSDEFLENVGWGENDVVEWVDNGDGTWLLKKQTNGDLNGTF